MTVDTIKEGWPSSLSEEFTNGTSTMDIDDRHFDDPDLDDEAGNHLLKVSMILVRLLWSSVMIFQQREMVIGVVEIVGSVSSSFPTLSTVPVLEAIVPLLVKVGDD
ncbi:hypothetical protein Adt_31865 [Abeliophyllum distichum]|uniref:Uncharacterized protein n=1 Tax=Abeliophyllum distichum TaxID=126358 RepID=A0ABD1RGD5_9LAMI